MSLTLNTTGVTIVDDTNSSIVYRGTWFTGGVSEEYRSTTHGTSTTGSSASFVFDGTSVAVYGTVGPEGAPSSTFSVDGSTPETHSASRFSPPVYSILFYQSPTLPAGTHTLVITDFSGSGNLWIDYILFLPSPGAAIPPPTPSDSPGSTGTTTASSSTRQSSSLRFSTVVTGPTARSSSVFLSSGLSTSTASSAPALAASTSNRTRIGAAIGGALGGLVLLILVVAVLYYRRLALALQRQNLAKKEVEPFPVIQQRYTSPYDGSNIPPPSKDARGFPANIPAGSVPVTYHAAYDGLHPGLNQPVSRPLPSIDSSSHPDPFPGAGSRSDGSLDAAPGNRAHYISMGVPPAYPY